MARAEIVWSAGTLMVGEDDFTYGRPYCLAVSLVVAGDGVVEVHGLDKTLTVEHWKAMGECFYRMGFREYRYERKRADGTTYWHQRSLERYKPMTK